MSRKPSPRSYLTLPAVLLAVVGVLSPLAAPAFGQAGGPPWVSLDHRAWPSPKAQVSQTIGVTEVSVSYSRPGVKGRTIWGELLAYDQVWRAGADWNTTLTFEDPVTVEGHLLAAGTYGLHVIPGSTSFTVAFSHFTKAWGSFSYQQEEDALRVEVTPRPAAHQEWLSYVFDHLTDTSAILSLRWDALEIPLRLEVDTHNIALARFRDGFRSLSGFSWMGKANAARYCLDNEVALEEGLQWIDEALEEQVAYDTLALKALLLDRLGRSQEAEPIYTQAVELASPRQLGFLGGRLIRADQPQKASRLLQRGAERHPESWRMRLHLARALRAAGDDGLARQAYAKALDLAPAERQPAISAQLEALGSASGP